ANLRHGSSNNGGDLPHLFHQFIKLIRKKRLRTVGERLAGPVVYLDQQSVRANCNGCAGERSDLVAFAGPVARIAHDWEGAQSFHRGHNTEIKRVSGVVGKRADAALAESDIVVALAEDVFSGHQEFLERR